ncbi:MAG: hypothetical protein HN341_19620 [Verrucomicrobia bacterium]|jgi:hypothetical protein|nr:hypothetical protein [Verrucomicrobiota bacterium]
MFRNLVCFTIVTGLAVLLGCSSLPKSVPPNLGQAVAKGPRAAGCLFVKTCANDDLACVNNACKMCGLKGTAWAKLPACHVAWSYFSSVVSIWCCPAGVNPDACSTKFDTMSDYKTKSAEEPVLEK